MTLEEKKKQYQKVLNDGYRASFPDVTEGLTDDEVSLMNPMTDLDFTIFLENELFEISKEISQILEEIQFEKLQISNPGIHYQEITERRTDIINSENKAAELREKYEEIKSFLPERENEDERSR